MNRESKTLAFEVKDLGIRKDDSGQEFGQIEAYGAMFNNVDEGKDRILPGAFTRTIKNSKSRAEARGKRYLVAMLWQHDDHEVIGGWYDVEQDSTGLRAKGDIALATQRGREFYALAKAGMTDEFSIIYDVPAGGAKFDKGGVRDLSELRLFSIDPVTFAMNDATYTVAVKSATQADKDAQEARSKKYGIAVKDGGNVTKPSEFSDVPDSKWADPVNYRYPMGDKAHADNAASRWGDTSNRSGYTSKEQGIISKRIEGAQASYGEGSDDNSKRVRRRMERKTFQEHYEDEQCEDLLEDWCDVILRAFTCAVFDAFHIGDEPESDVNDALDGLKDAVTEWVANAVKYGLSDYIDEQGFSSDGGTQSTMIRGGDRYSSYLGYFSRYLPMSQKARKAMTASDATTGGFTADHVSKLQKAAEKALKATDEHANMLYDTAMQVKKLVQAGGDGVVEAGNAKAGRAFSAANATTLTDHADALEGAADGIQKTMKRQMKMVTNVADDLATVIQGSEAAYGTDRGKPDDGNQEGKDRSGRASRDSSHARATRQGAAPSHSADTPPEEDIEAALQKLKKLRTPVPA